MALPLSIFPLFLLPRKWALDKERPIYKHDRMKSDFFPDMACFKAYDIRGKAPGQIDERFAEALGIAAAEILGAGSAVIGYDARISGPALHDALCRGLHATGATVKSLGMCGTEEIYFASGRGLADLGVMITGSHNPADENGFKLVRSGAIPVSGGTGLAAIGGRMAQIAERLPPRAGCMAQQLLPAMRKTYVDWLVKYTGAGRPGGKVPLRVVADAGNGCAGLVLRELMPRLDMELVGLNMRPDGTFPNGVPNPLLPQNRAATAAAVVENRADFGLAWDGDFDRCFFYDHAGRFIEGYYMVGLLAREMLGLFPAGKIIHDTRVYWNTRRVTIAHGGQPVMGRTGHAFMKELMRRENAVYGGEMSAHHYFRDFSYCDSGMLPWLLVTGLIRRTGATLAELVDEGMRLFPCSGEINRKVGGDSSRLLHEVGRRFGSAALHEDHLDGLNLEFAEWRFNLRMSNTEPLLRLNVEARGDSDLLEEKTALVLATLDELDEPES